MTMSIKKIGDNITDVDGKFRIESGPLRKRETVTKELLDDAVTAEHYKVGQPDAFNKPIKIGEMMNYIDWKSKDKVFYLYEKKMVEETVMVEGKSIKQSSERFVLVGQPSPDYETALSRIVELAVNSK